MGYREDCAKWYNKKAWRGRAKAQLRAQPLCKMCNATGVVRQASVADHVVPHRGDSKLFWFGELQSLCWSHHSKSKQQMETIGYSKEIGSDGFPLDPNHPFNKASG
jgi:5-methylcytosine-specific restriction endonuclease McrA